MKRKLKLPGEDYRAMMRAQVTEEFLLVEQEYLACRQLPDGRWLAVKKMLSTYGLLMIESIYGYEYRYCYEHWAHAVIAMETWNAEGDPPGPWIKQKPPDRLNPALARDDFDMA